jgi:AAA family ATPase
MIKNMPHTMTDNEVSDTAERIQREHGCSASTTLFTSYFLHFCVCCTVQLAQIASVTHGYVGADLKALCREAALVALERFQQQQPDWMDQLQQPPAAATAAGLPASPSAATSVLPLSSSSLVSPSSSSSLSLSLSHGDFARALPSVKPSAMRSLVIDVPRVSWNDIGGQEDVKQKLREAVDWPLQVSRLAAETCAP